MTRFLHWVAACVYSPAATARAVPVGVSPRRVILPVLAVVILMGAATLPRQLHFLAMSLTPTGKPIIDYHHTVLRPGLVRLMLLDRLVPPPTVLLASLFVFWAADGMLHLGGSHRQRVGAIIAMGLVPLLLQRAGELAISWLAVPPPHVLPGFAVSLPQQFATGATLFWPPGEAPGWAEAVGARLNLVTLWSVALWSVGLRELDGEGYGPFHLLLPVMCLAAAGFITWSLGPPLWSIVLGNP